MQLREVDADGVGSYPHEGMFDDMQDVKPSAERPCKLPPVIERRLGRIAEIYCDKDVREFDHMSTFHFAREHATCHVRIAGRCLFSR